MTSVTVAPLAGVLRAPVPLQVELSAQFLVGIAGTIFLMLLFLMVVVLWDIALALRDVAEKIDYLEDDVDSDLATINGTLTRIYDRMGSGSGASGDGAAGAPAGVQSTNGAGVAGGMPVGAGGPAAATEAPGGGGVAGPQAAGADATGAAAAAGGGVTGYDGRRPVANAPTAANEAATAGSDAVGGDARVDDAVDDAVDGTVDNETGPAAEDGGAVDAAGTDRPTQRGSVTDGETTDGDTADDEITDDEITDDEPVPESPSGEPSVDSASMAAGDGPTPEGASSNVGLFAPDGSGDQAWYDVTMSVPRTGGASDSPASGERDGDGTGAYGLNESALRAGLGEASGPTGATAPSEDEDASADEDAGGGTPDLGGEGAVDAEESSVDADEVMRSDAVRDAYVDPVSAFGEDEFGTDRSQPDRRVSLDELQHDADESGDDDQADNDQTGDDPTGNDQSGDDPTTDDQAGDDASERSSAVDEEDGIERLDDAGTAIVDEETVRPGSDGTDGVSDVGAGDAGPEAVTEPAGEEAVRSLAETKERIRERHADEDGDLDYQSLQGEAAATDGVKGSGLPAEEMLDALAAAAVHEDAADVDAGDASDGEDVTDDDDGNNDDDATDGDIEELLEAADDPAGTDADAIEDALAERREESDDRDEGVDVAGPSAADGSADDDGIAELVNRELDTLTEEVGGTSMTPDVSGAELDTAVAELDDGSYTFPLSGSSFDVNAIAQSETATLSFTPDEEVDLDGARERLLKYQLRNYLDRDDTAHAELSVEGGTVQLEIPAANGPAVDGWADAAVQIIDRTLYLSKDDD